MISSQSQSLKMRRKSLDSIIESKMQQNPLSDNSLMLKVRDGDLQKLGLLFERYKNILFAYFFKLSKDQVMAEDLVQMVFIRVIKYKHAYRGDGSFKTWIFHIARNIHVDNWRKESKLGFKVSTTEIEVRGDEDKEAEVKAINLQILEQALALLPSDQRELIVLGKLKGMKYREIGELLNITESNVKIKAFRALKALKEKFKEIEKQDSYE